MNRNEAKRKDAVRLSNGVVVLVSCGGGMVRIQSEKWFVRANGRKALAKIESRTFGSKQEDEIKAFEMYTGRLSIEAVLNM